MAMTVGRYMGLMVALLATAGCHTLWPHQPLTEPIPYVGADGRVEYDTAPPHALPNPIVIHSPNHDLLWEGVVDVVEDYFRIQREDRVRQVGNVLVEGSIETYPVTGATVLEPWRKDAVGARNRWESTFQSIRRLGFIRVIPSGSAYLIEVQVQKELEDVERPERATAGSIQFRESLDRRGGAGGALAQPPATLGWIGLGRDLALEQRILADLQARFGASG
ncbi:MAG TPA: hypothetical protein VMX74_06670 [Pirellulales bacterium]|nr:hypothetical protein [Pirellulales bacterium]